MGCMSSSSWWWLSLSLHSHFVRRLTKVTTEVEIYISSGFIIVSPWLPQWFEVYSSPYYGDVELCAKGVASGEHCGGRTQRQHARQVVAKAQNSRNSKSATISYTILKSKARESHEPNPIIGSIYWARLCNSILASSWLDLTPGMYSWVCPQSLLCMCSRLIKSAPGSYGASALSLSATIPTHCVIDPLHGQVY